MNFFTAAVSVAAMISSAAAAISFTSPNYGFWYTNAPNFMTITSTDASELYATVRFTSCNECFSLSVTTNTTVPVTLPRRFRSNNYLNLFAISNLYNTASTAVNVIDTLCVTAGNPCQKPCGRKSRDSRRSRGCGYYAEDSQAQQEQSELVYIEHDSEEAKALQAQQEQAAADLAEDLLAINAPANEAPQVVEA